MEDALEFDHDEVVQTRGSLSELKELVMANATGISEVIFKCQVDDFAIAATDERTANILLDLIDDELSIPMK
jgi:hypothetical protein